MSRQAAQISRSRFVFARNFLTKRNTRVYFQGKKMPCGNKDHARSCRSGEICGFKPGPQVQQGAATLLIALVLMMSITIVTLAVARTLVVEQRMANNDHWNTRLFLQAEAGLAKGLAYLTRSMPAMSWKLATDTNTLVDKMTLASADPGVQTEVVFSHQTDSDQYISVRATSRRNDGSNIQVRIAQTVRPLSVLTPLAESAPPLILNGCPLSVPINFDIRPLNADSDQAGDSLWLDVDRPCSTLKRIDTHGGPIKQINMGNDVWPLVFSVSRETFVSLATEQRGLADGDRQYWLAEEADLNSGRWNRSLGSAHRPVVLYFSAAMECPEFSAGVRLYGVVFIDTDCPEPIAGYGFAVFGSLIVNGKLNVWNTKLQLNHIQLADRRQTRLHFPLLRSVRVPGSWKDF
jgi:Tfp pilus assembly protein PilX